MMIKRLYDTLVGASVGENQLMPISSTSRSATIQGVTFVDNRDGSYTFYTGENGASATATFSIISKIDGGSPQHVYYLKGNAEGSSISTWYLADQYNGVFDYDFKKENIVKVLRDTPARLDLRVIVASGTVISAPVTIKPQVIDLTAYFSSASIADYLYSLEAATAGAGVAKLREWGFFTEEYIPYNPGALESVEATAHKMVGFNQWDEEWENGFYDNVGVFFQNSSYIAAKNKIPVLPSTEYIFHSGSKNGGRVCFYDKEETFVYTQTGFGSVENWLFTTPANAFFMTFDMTSAYGNVYNHDICINLSSDRNGEYEAYASQTYDYGDDTLRGIFKLDSNNELYADGDVKTSDGVITRKYGLLDLGTLNYNYYEGSNYTMFITNELNIANKERWNGICDIYPLVASAVDTLPDKAISTQYSDGRLRIKDSSYTDVASFKQAMSGKYLVCALQTPTTEQGDPFPSPQIVYPDGTEEYVTSNGVPVGHETRYQL